MSVWTRLARAVSAALATIVARLLLLKPPQLLVLGFLSYVVLGVGLLSLPIAQEQGVGLLDNLFNVTSAMSTTGLVTVSVSDSYTFYGQLVLFVLFQLGGIGYMTVSSFILLARGKPLASERLNVLRTEFALPKELEVRAFIRQVVVFTVAIEAAGAALLYWPIRAAGDAHPLWSAIFHSVSAFATAGFGLYNDSFEGFRANGFVCLVIGVLAYLGALGFIVIQDTWRTLRGRQQRITFTSRVILTVTAGVFLLGTPILFFTDDSLQAMPIMERLCAAAFQVMTASTTVGFNTVPISGLAAASITLTIIMMIIGASPSGTGGGLKTTTFSSLLAVLTSIVRGRANVLLFQHEIPIARVLTATASAALYIILLAAGVFLLCLVEQHRFNELVFEAASALGTVGLSMGITGSLTVWGKVVVTLLMFLGRVGPLTIGLALIRRAQVPALRRMADLAV